MYVTKADYSTRNLPKLLTSHGRTTVSFVTILKVLPGIANAGSLTSFTCWTAILLSLRTPEKSKQRIRSKQRKKKVGMQFWGNIAFDRCPEIFCRAEQAKFEKAFDVESSRDWSVLCFILLLSASVSFPNCLILLLRFFCLQVSDNCGKDLSISIKNFCFRDNFPQKV